MAPDLSSLHRSIIAHVPDLLQVNEDSLIEMGLIGASLSLDAEQLHRAYEVGLFPWFNPEDYYVLWWFPPQRMVLRCEDFHVSKNFRKLLKQIQKPESGIIVSTDRAFVDVINACAEPRRDQEGTWISDQIINGYTEMHRQGIAHSVEVWEHGELVGGLYGMSLGRMFYGESMFSRRDNASKIALYYLTRFLLRRGIDLIDCQQKTDHLASLGGGEMPAMDFFKALRSRVALPSTPWSPQELDWEGFYKKTQDTSVEN